MKWHKVKIGDFLKRVKDLVPILEDVTYNLVTIKLYHKGVKLRKTVRGAEMQAEKMSKVKAGQFILSGIDARNGAFGIIPPELEGAVVTNDFWHFEIDRKIISNEYFLWLTSTPYFDDICNKASDGTTNRIRLQADRFYSQGLMLPEIQDQHIVVENLKSTNQKIKQLEIEYKFQLTQIENLNQAILQEAVQGKLVAKNPADEPATELLKRIKADKEKLGKKDKPLPPIKPEEIPFEIPENWVWCRLGEVCSKIGSGSTPKGSNYSKTGFPFFRSQNIYNNGLIYNNIKFVSEEVQKQMNGTVVFANDILLNITGGSLGRCTIVPNDFGKGNVSQHVCIIRPLQVDINYFHKIVLSPYFQRFVFSSTTGAGREGLPKYNLEQFAIPLPPLPEQKRIVAEIEKQLAKTKQLKQHIIANQQATEQLLKALLHQAFEVGEKEETAKEPKGKVIPLHTNPVNYENLIAEPTIDYGKLNDNSNAIKDKDLELAIVVEMIQSKLGINYGEVALQKTVFNAGIIKSIFSKPYQFIKSNFGTYSFELKEDLKNNIYLVKQKVKGKEVFAVNPQHKKKVLDSITSGDSKYFINTIAKLLSIYELPFINKGTNRIELLNTVLKIMLDAKTVDIKVVYKEMKKWKIEQEGYATKADKFNIADTQQMIKLITNQGLIK